MSSLKTPARPACHFIWSLTPILEATKTSIAVAMNRQEVVTKFTASGYGKFALSGGASAAAPYMGVAFVACAVGSLPRPTPTGNLRVAFVLAGVPEIHTYHFLFRTVGFDWVATDHFAEPYIAELFALTSLYDVSKMIYDKTKFTQTVTSSAQHDLFGIAELEELRQSSQDSVRVGNRSDGQLGNSRGSCLLVADVSGLKAALPKVHVAPSAVTPDLSTADRSLVLLPANAEPISLPCTLVSALVTRNMSAASDFPPALTGTTLRYYPAQGESMGGHSVAVTTFARRA